MPQDKLEYKSVQLLRKHRDIFAKQLFSITETIREIDTLLASRGKPHPSTFSINDKVISLSAPNKNRIGLVTKTSPFFISVKPLNTKHRSFKKDPQNLSHYSFLNVVSSLQPKSLPTQSLNLPTATKTQKRSCPTHADLPTSPTTSEGQSSAFTPPPTSPTTSEDQSSDFTSPPLKRVRKLGRPPSRPRATTAKTARCARKGTRSK